MNDPLDPQDSELGESEPREEADGELGPNPPDPRPPRPEPPDPTPDVPEVPSPAEDLPQASPEVKTLFWKLVLLYKVSLLGLSIGALLVVFDAAPRRGAILFAGALVFFVYTLVRTRETKRRLDAGEVDLQAEADSESSHAAGDSPDSDPGESAAAEEP